MKISLFKIIKDGDLHVKMKSLIMTEQMDKEFKEKLKGCYYFNIIESLGDLFAIICYDNDIMKESKYLQANLIKKSYEKLFFMLEEKGLQEENYVDNPKKSFVIESNWLSIFEEENKKKALSLIKELNNLPTSILGNIFNFKISENLLTDKPIFVKKIEKENNQYHFSIYSENNLFSKKHCYFVFDATLPSSRDENYLEEFRFKTIESAINFYFNHRSFKDF